MVLQALAQQGVQREYIEILKNAYTGRLMEITLFTFSSVYQSAEELNKKLRTSKTIFRLFGDGIMNAG